MRVFEYPEYVEFIMNRLAAAGEEAYIVGGCLRDSLLGRTPDDFDMATSALPEKTVSIFADQKLLTMGLKHGTVTVIVDSHPVEITTFRVDGGYSDSRHPDEVRFTSRIEEDLSRRDFTVNAMAYNHAAGLVDPFGGRADLDARLVRAVGEPSRRFDEDALRIMRAFRFSAQLGFEIENATLIGARQTREGLSKVARERIGVEFSKLLTSPSPVGAIEKMLETQTLGFVVGNYIPSEKILASLAKMPRELSARLGFFLSDTSAEEAQKIMRELRLSGKIISEARAVLSGSSACVDSEESAARFSARLGNLANTAILASVLLGNSPERAVSLVESRAGLPKSLKDLKINGSDLASLGFSGKEIGRALGELLDAVVQNPALNDREALTSLALKIKKG